MNNYRLRHTSGRQAPDRLRAAFDVYLFAYLARRGMELSDTLRQSVLADGKSRALARWFESRPLTEGFFSALNESPELSILCDVSLLTGSSEDGFGVLASKRLQLRRHRRDSLSAEERLRALIRDTVLSENGRAEHLFLLSLAYLHGNEVPMDAGHAAELLKKAAESGLSDACEMLSEMYENAEGVERSIRSSARWQREYVTALRYRALSGCDCHILERLYDAQWRLGKLLRAARDMTGATAAFTDMLSTAYRMEELGISGAMRKATVAMGELGNVCKAECDPAGARTWYCQCMKLRSTMAEAEDSDEARLDLGAAYVSVGDISMAEGDHDDARSWYLRSLAVFEEISPRLCPEKADEYISLSCERTATSYAAEDELSAARDWYMRLLSRNETAAQTRRNESLIDLSSAYEGLGSISLKESSLSEARSWFEKCLEIRKGIAERSGSAVSHAELARALERMGDVCMADSRRADARVWYESSLTLLEDTAKEPGTAEYKRLLSLALEKLGDLCAAEEDSVGAEARYRRAIALTGAAFEESGVLSVLRELGELYDKLGNLLQRLLKSEGWAECQRQRLSALETAAERSGTVADEDAVLLCLIHLAVHSGEKRESIYYYEYMLDVATGLYERTGLERYSQAISAAERELAELQRLNEGGQHE